MNSGQIAQINLDRLHGWAHELTDHHATPVLCIGVGHDHMSGTTHILIPDPLPREYAINALKTALAVLETEVE